MTITTRLWLGTFVALVFTAGALAGILIDRAVARDGGVPAVNPGGRGARGGGPQGGGPPVDRLVDSLDRTLSFTDAQRQAVRGVLDQRRARLQVLQETTRRQFLDEQQTLLDELAAVLTPEQATELRNLVANRPGVFGPAPGPGGGRGGRGREGPRGGFDGGRGPRAGGRE